MARIVCQYWNARLTMYRLLKINQWWGNKITPLLSFVFLGTAHHNDAPSFFSLTLHLLLFLVACFAIAGFGHLFLDAYDCREDQLNGKSNGWVTVGGIKGVIVLLILFCSSWVFIYFLPHWTTVRWMLALQFLFFVLYAVPPVRCKERGILGVFIDALYGYVMPALVAWSIFAPEAEGRWVLLYAFCLLLWLLPKGIRHILRHQYYDIDGDHKAGLGTFAVRHGRSGTLRLIQFYILPFELAACTLALTVFSWPNLLPVIGFMLFFGWEWRVLRLQWLQPVPALMFWKPIEWSEWLGMRFLTIFTEILLPLLSLCVMLMRHPSLWPMSFVYVLLAGPQLRIWWLEVSPLVIRRFI